MRLPLFIYPLFVQDELMIYDDVFKNLQRMFVFYIMQQNISVFECNSSYGICLSATKSSSIYFPIGSILLLLSALRLPPTWPELNRNRKPKPDVAYRLIVFLLCFSWKIIHLLWGNVYKQKTVCYLSVSYSFV